MEDSRGFRKASRHGPEGLDDDCWRDGTAPSDAKYSKFGPGARRSTP